MYELSGDWADVLRRAELQRRARQRRVAVGTAALIAVVGGGSALAARALFHGAKPHGADRAAIRDLIPPDPVLQLMGRQSEHVLLARAHGLVQIRTARGVVRLWAVPLSTGGRCFTMTGAGTSGGGVCVTPRTKTPPIVAGGFWTSNEPVSSSRHPWIYEGFVRVPAASVELEFRGRRNVEVPLVERAFLVALPPGPTPVAAVARGRSGRVVARVSLLPHPSSSPRPHYARPPRAVYHRVYVLSTRDQYLELWVGRNAHLRCYRLVHGSGVPRALLPPAHCYTGRRLRLDVEPLDADGRDYLLTGYAGRRGVRELDIGFAAAATRRVPLHGGFALAELRGGTDATTVTARDARGRVVWRSRFDAVVHARIEAALPR